MKTMIIIIIILLSTSIAYSQIPGDINVKSINVQENLFLGFKSGFTFTQLIINNTNLDCNPTLHFGFLLKDRIDKRNQFFQYELLFREVVSNGISKDMIYDELKAEFNLNFIEFRFSFIDKTLIKNDNLNLLAGQSVGFGMKSEFLNRETGEWEEMKQIHSGYSGTFIGCGFQVGNFMLQADICYTYIIGYHSEADWRNIYIQSFEEYLSISYLF